ncbi:Transcription factor [Stylosanthes scabra]|uniref:WRKY transcription factor n=1 Tax=Stylosanthes scabra TaxID=79078 RepID=A0ABU6USI4_9FABA|nr:Transcription factor [Stylosanthes scabra]
MAVKTEDYAAVSFGSSNGYYNHNNPLLLSSSSAFDFCQVEKSELGFMELLGVKDYYTSGGAALLDFPHFSPKATVLPSSPVVKASCDGDSGKECSEVLNHQHHQQPATPNSSSISSASSEALNDEHNKTVEQGVDDDDDEEHDEEQQQKKTKKQLKVKKTKQKRQREARFAFMTKSEVDHLEDGYRWRKYGQKAVKNSPFPRSYYRCTSASCNVKKRVERSFTDPSVVVTTYEGQHSHPSPVMPRSAIAGSLMMQPLSVSTTNLDCSLMPGNYLYHQQQQRPVNPLTSLGFAYNNTNNINSASFSQDNGLLQDILPSHMLKEH